MRYSDLFVLSKERNGVFSEDLTAPGVRQANGFVFSSALVAQSLRKGVVYVDELICKKQCGSARRI